MFCTTFQYEKSRRKTSTAVNIIHKSLHLLIIVESLHDFAIKDEVMLSYCGISSSIFPTVFCSDVTVVRSCPSAIWPKKISSAEWEKSTNVVYDGSSGEFQVLRYFVHGA